MSNTACKVLEQNSFTVNIEYTLSCQYVTVDALRQLIEGAHRNSIESSTEWRYRLMYPNT